MSAVRVEPPSTRTIPKAASDFPIRTIASTARTRSGGGGGGEERTKKNTPTHKKKKQVRDYSLKMCDAPAGLGLKNLFFFVFFFFVGLKFFLPLHSLPGQPL